MKIKSAAFFILALILAIHTPVLSDDGFYEGSGSVLVPIKNESMRVQSAKLTISPLKPNRCYELLVDGKKLRVEYPALFKPRKDYAEIGKQTACEQEKFHVFAAEWHAVAEYNAGSIAGQKNILMGFPIPRWDVSYSDSEGLEDIDAPGVSNFHVFVNQARIDPLELKWISHPSFFRYESKDKYLAYTWRQSFKAGTRYDLKTEYDFGVDYCVGFYEGNDEGHQFRKGERPWFIAAESTGPSAVTVLYYLTPISLWGNPPPKTFDVRVKAQQGLSITYAVPKEQKPTCVDSKELVYAFRNEFPTRELEVSFPDVNKWKEPRPAVLKSVAEWKQWVVTIGGPKVNLTCELIDEVKSSSSQTLAKFLGNIHCVKTCD